MSGETVLIVEDEALISLHLKRILASFGYSVLQTIDTGMEAVRWAEVLRPDLILMDIQLRGEMDGIETARQIRQRLDLPIIFLTSYAEDSRLNQARTTVPYGYLLKPVQERELRSTLEMALYKHKLDLKLKESEMAYRELYHTTPAMLHTTDVDARILQVSDYWLSMLGYTREEVVGRSITDFVTPSSRKLVLEEFIPRSFHASSIRDAECQFLTKKGHVMDALFSAISVFDDHGALMYTHSAIVDITARKCAEAAERDQRTLAEALRDTAASLNTTLSLEEVLERVMEQVGKVLPYHAVNMMIVENGVARVVRALGFAQDGPIADALNRPRVVNETLYLSTMADSGKPLVMANTQLNKQWNMALGCSYIGAPIIIKGRLAGFINLFGQDPNFYKEDQVGRLQAFSNQVAIAIENANLYAEVQRLATMDELTNIYNRRHLFDLGERELERSRRYQSPLCAILLDIDHFKKVNDTYGHNTGDRVLAGIAALINSNVREIDLFGRYGGEEFVILLSQSEVESAIEVADRLRELVAQQTYETDEGLLSVTISLGIAQITPDVTSLASLIDRADQAMYAAKLKGRNRVEVYAG